METAGPDGWLPATESRLQTGYRKAPLRRGLPTSAPFPASEARVPGRRDLLRVRPALPATAGAVLPGTAVLLLAAGRAGADRRRGGHRALRRSPSPRGAGRRLPGVAALGPEGVRRRSPGRGGRHPRARRRDPVTRPRH